MPCLLYILLYFSGLYRRRCGNRLCRCAVDHDRALGRNGQKAKVGRLGYADFELSDRIVERQIHVELFDTVVDKAGDNGVAAVVAVEETEEAASVAVMINGRIGRDPTLRWKAKRVLCDKFDLYKKIYE